MSVNVPDTVYTPPVHPALSKASPDILRRSRFPRQASELTGPLRPHHILWSHLCWRRCWSSGLAFVDARAYADHLLVGFCNGRHRCRWSRTGRDSLFGSASDSRPCSEFERTTFPAPIAAEARAMPSHQRLGPDGCHRLHDRWKPPIQLQEEQAIAVRKLDPTAHLALKHNQLTSERSVLSLKPADRPERRTQQPQKEEEQRDHRGRRYVIPLPDQTDEVFGTHKYQRKAQN